MTVLPFLGNHKKYKAMAQNVKKFNGLVRDRYTFLMERLEKVLKDYFDLSMRMRGVYIETLPLREQLARVVTSRCVSKKCLQHTQSEASISGA